MSERKPCVRCARQIDAAARVCPYCNWWQSETPPPPDPEPVEATPAAPLPWWKNQELLRQRRELLQNRALVAIGIAALLIIAFVVGSFVHGFGDTELKAAQKSAADTAQNAVNNPKPPSNVTLVPVTDSGGIAPVLEAPITSAPSTGTAQGPDDTTALPSNQYAAAAARARARQQADEQQRNNVTDPRSLTGAPYQAAEKAPPPETPRETEAAQPAQRTSALPQYKPLPRLNLDREMVARLTVTVGSDGRVTDIEVNQPIPQMPKVIAAVQNWRFKPATENGLPVPARVAVDIIFHGNGG